MGELFAESRLSAATVAHHTKILTGASLTQVMRRGRYRLIGSADTTDVRTQDRPLLGGSRLRAANSRTVTICSRVR